MIDKIVLYTVEKKTKRHISMVLICRDSARKDTDAVQVIFGAIKPQHMGRDLLPFKRKTINCREYHLLAMDLYLARKIRHSAFGKINQELAWKKAIRCADRFIIKAGSLVKNTGGSKHGKRYEDIKEAFDIPPPIAVLITNNISLEGSAKVLYNSNKKNE